jgi:uncharacterized protein YwgA
MPKLDRIALITELVDRAPVKLGRTALMKCLFFLKALRNVPLPYSFRLYTYGPFDSDVLDDLQYAEFLGAVESTLVRYPGGRGYEYELGPKAEKIRKQADEFLERHKESIDWVLKEFGNRSALDLEMASTLVYIDRSVAERGKRKTTIAELVRKVGDVKPHLATEAIEREAQDLNERGFLKTVA